METGIDFSYLATGNLDNARWMRLEGSFTYHVIADSGTAEGHAFCRKSITGFVVGVPTTHVKGYGVMCERCRVKLAKVAAAYAAQPVESAAQATETTDQGEGTQGTQGDVSDAREGDTIRHRKSGETLRVVTYWQNTAGDLTELIVTRDRDNCFSVYREQFPAYELAERKRMEITQRQVSTYVRKATTHETTEIHATTYYYSRTINGTPYAFTFVLMRNGERRHFVSKYNGYCQSAVYNGLMSLQSVLMYACAWSQVHAIIVRHPDDMCDRCGYCERNACNSHKLCHC